MKLLNYISLFLLLFVTAACEKDLMTYSGEEALYFDVRWHATAGDEINEWPHQNYSLVQFGKMTGETSTLSLCIRVTGSAKDHDRSFGLEVLRDSTTAILGEEYLEFDSHPVIKAGELATTVDITVKRSARMSKQEVVLMLRIVPGDNMTVKFPDYGDSAGHWPADYTYGGNKDASMHKIVINDFISRPDGWYGDDVYGSGLFGAFSEKKYHLLMEVTGTTVADFESKQMMPTARAQSIGEQFGRYLLEQAAKGREYAVLEEDGTMMYCYYVSAIGGNNAWQPFTTPDQYYQ